MKLCAPFHPSGRTACTRPRMPGELKVVHSPDRDDEWAVALDGQYVVGFYGRGAREMAERHRTELAEMLTLREQSMPAVEDAANTASKSVDDSAADPHEAAWNSGTR